MLVFICLRRNEEQALVNNPDTLQFCNKFFVGLHGDKTYNIFVCGNTT
jgi:hypothetical protein